MSDCLVIGGNGFIGSHVVDALAAAGHDVTVFDRFSGGKFLFYEKNVEIWVGDFLNSGELSDALRNRDYVFHFLSTTNPAVSESDPTLDIRTNVSQSIDLFRMCSEQGVQRVYFASSGGAIYGDQARTSYRETDLTLPVSPYGIGKLTIEHYLRYFRTKHGLESVSLRISNPYGTRQHPHRKQGFIPIALRQIALGEPVTRFGTGAMVRDFIYVQDVARMVGAMVKPSLEHDTYNIGSGSGSSVNEVIATMRSVTGSEIALLEKFVPSTFVQEVVLDTTRFRDEFDVGNLKSLEEGISDTWEYELQSFLD